jgi:hypothetical protein
VRRAAANRMSQFHRLGIILVILGMMQSLAPMSFRPTRDSLRLRERLQIALAPYQGVAESPDQVLWISTPIPADSRQDPESDQESHDTEDLAETFAWSDAITVGRSIQRSSTASQIGPAPRSERAAHRTSAALQRSRALPCLSILTSSMTTRLCRFTC